MKSKVLFRAHVQALLDTGCNQKDVALKLGYKTPNIISMMMSDQYRSSLISPNRIQALKDACHLSPRDVMELMVARLTDAGDNKIEMNPETLQFILCTHDLVVKENHAREVVAP
jgi:hypothetical protein